MSAGMVMSGGLSWSGKTSRSSGSGFDTFAETVGVFEREDISMHIISCRFCAPLESYRNDSRALVLLSAEYNAV